ncbi:MAG: ATP-binding protein [Anaerovoracaceae bacterium]|jgi:DNA polymerase-3 subunit delta'
MSFNDIKGNKNITERMSRAIRNRNISHAYLLEGDSTTDKIGLAENFAKAILCENTGAGDSCEFCQSCSKVNHGNHEDIIYIKAEGNSIKDESIEELQSKIRNKPFAGDRTVVIVQDADTMTLRAQNRLLKTLEEPAPGTVLILLSENVENLTETIRSRCITYKLNPVEISDYKDIISGSIQILDMILKGAPFYKISKKLVEYTTDRPTAQSFLNAFESWCRDLAISEYDTEGRLLFQAERLEEIRKRAKLYSGNFLENAIIAIEEARNDLNRNLNINYTLKNLTLKILDNMGIQKEDN